MSAANQHDGIIGAEFHLRHELQLARMMLPIVLRICANAAEKSGGDMNSNHRPGPDPVRSPPEVPVVPGPQPEIEPGYRPGPEIPEPPPDPQDPTGPQGPEIIPDPSPPEYPDPGIPGDVPQPD